MNQRIKKAVEAIMNIQDNYELNEVIQAIKLKQTYLQQSAKRQFVAGDKVEFDSRSGQTLQGTISRIKQKYILVEVKGSSGYPMRYNCPATMLRKVA
jgi:hypothetical protein